MSMLGKGIYRRANMKAHTRVRLVCKTTPNCSLETTIEQYVRSVTGNQTRFHDRYRFTTRDLNSQYVADEPCGPILEHREKASDRQSEPKPQRRKS